MSSKPDGWGVIDIEPTDRVRILPDGRKMRESRITVTREWMEQMWQGYRCAVCLEDVSALGAFPAKCPNDWCDFPIRKMQRKQLEEDFAGEVEAMRRDGWLEREQAHLEEEFFIPKPQITVRRDL